MSAGPLRVVLLGDGIVPNAPRLREKAAFPCVAVEVRSDATFADRDAALADADAVIVNAFSHPSRHARRLRLIQVQGAGYERVDLGCVPDHASVCNAFGHTRAAAEYALMTMLMWTHRWKEVEESFRGGSWAFSSARNGPLRDELNSRTVGIVGLGQMGREVATRARAMGVAVLGCGRSAPSAPDLLDAWYPLDRLDEFLPRCDFVILCIALAPETTGLIDCARLSRMKPDAVLINLARGPVVVEEALYEALVSNRIAGAILDVWWQYPDDAEPDRRGSKLPFHELRNVWMTPHSSQWTEQMMDRRWDMIVDNLSRLHRGEPLRHVLRPPLRSPAA
jgi:phosphoglycerate dehydrogenase-like enzyme